MSEYSSPISASLKAEEITNLSFMETIKILFWLYRSKINKDKQVPVYLRITVKGKKVEIATGYWINANDWNTDKQQAKGVSKSSALINTYVVSTKSKILQIQYNLTHAGISNFTADLVKQKLLGTSSEKKTLLDLFDYHNNQVKEQIGKDFRVGTYKHYVVTRNKVSNFLKHTYRSSDFELENLSHKFVTDFEYYLKLLKD